MINDYSRIVTDWRINFRAALQPKVAFAAALALQAASIAWGQGLTYVDAETGGPTANLTPLSAIDTVAEDDDQWFRRGFGVNSTIFESGLEEPPELTQTIRSLNAGTSYDVYVVHWTDATNWTIAGGLTPGQEVIYNRAGPNPYFPTATASTPAGYSHWSVPPPLYQEGNRVMVLGKIGSKVADGAGEINVYINDPGGAGTNDSRSWLDGVAYVPTATPNVTLSATIDRTTGILSLNNPTSVSFQISTLSIQSGAGTLDPLGWTSISDAYDADSGNPIVDPNDNWNESAATATALSEAEAASPTVAGGVLAAGSSLSLGSVSKLSVFEDISVVMKLNDIDANSGTNDTFRLIASYAGGTAVAAGDLNADGVVDIANDYAALVANLNDGQSSGLNAYERYRAGDMTNNNSVNYNDLVLFREAYDAANGFGAFEAALSVPEPAGLALAGLGVAAVAAATRTRRRSTRRAGQASALATLLAAAWLAASAPSVSANPVTGWAIDPTVGIGVPGDVEPALSGAGTASPTIGDGTRNNADGVAFYASMPQVTLADRQEITLSGTMTLSGSDNPAHGDFRWGLFHEGGTVDTLGWRGYLAENASGDNAGVLNAKNPNDSDWATASFASTGSGVGFGIGNALNYDPFDLFVDGVYDFELTIGRFGADVSVRAKLTSASGFTNTVGPATDPASAGRLTYDFNRVGFLAGGNLNANQLAFSGIDVTSPASIAALSLRVTTSGPNAGKTEIVNTVGGGPIDMAYYEIASAGGALDVGGYTSLDDAEGDAFGLGWEEGGGNSGVMISEAVLNPNDAATLAVTNSLSLGNAFDAGGAEDLVFIYGLPDGTQIRGLVDYVAGATPGDFNGDTFVDGADLAQWEGDFGANDESDADGDGDSDGNDFLVWQRNVGAPAASPAGAPVPEPASLLLAAIALAPWAVRCRAPRGR